MLKRFKWGVRVTALALGLAMTAALAFFVGSFMADGTHTGTAGSGGTGTQTLPVKVDFPNALLTPTKTVPLTAEVENTSSKTVMFGGVHPTVTTGAAGCNAAWFHVKATGTSAAKWNGILKGELPVEAKYPPGASPVVTDAGTNLILELEETGSSQAPCESANVTVAFHLNE
jgi:hypothetical protein